MATLLSTAFTGTDGAAWPSPWTSPAGVTIQGNRGQQVSPTTQWSPVLSSATVNNGNVRIVATIRFPGAATGKAMMIDGRYVSGTGDGDRLLITSSGLAIYKIAAFTE